MTLGMDDYLDLVVAETKMSLMTSTLIHQRGRSTVILTHSQLGCFRASATLTEANLSTGQSRSAPRRCGKIRRKPADGTPGMKICRMLRSAGSSFLHVSQPGVGTTGPSNQSLFIC